MGLLDQDVLVMSQVTSFMSNDFAIHDEAGQQVGHVSTEGGLGSRLLMGSRQFTISDGSGPLLQVNDVPNIGRDSFELSDPSGQRIGRVVKQFSLFKKRLSLELAGVGEFDLLGNWFDFSFEVTGPSGVVATISRSWPGVMGGLLDRSRFVLAFTPGVPTEVRRGAIGAVVAVDLIRAKEEKAGAASS